MRARWLQKTFEWLDQRPYAAELPFAQFQYVRAESPFSWIEYGVTRPFFARFAEVAPDFGADFARAVHDQLSTPLFAPLVKPMLEVFGMRTPSIAIPKGWALTTQSMGVFHSTIDERATWLLLHELTPALRHDELFHEIVHHTLAGILLDFPDVRIWREPAKEDDSKLVFALHSVEHRKAAGFGTK